MYLDKDLKRCHPERLAPGEPPLFVGVKKREIRSLLLDANYRSPATAARNDKGP